MDFILSCAKEKSPINASGGGMLGIQIGVLGVGY